MVSKSIAVKNLYLGKVALSPGPQTKEKDQREYRKNIEKHQNEMIDYRPYRKARGRVQKDYNEMIPQHCYKEYW